MILWASKSNTPQTYIKYPTPPIVPVVEKNKLYYYVALVHHVLLILEIRNIYTGFPNFQSQLQILCDHSTSHSLIESLEYVHSHNLYEMYDIPKNNTTNYSYSSDYNSY